MTPMMIAAFIASAGFYIVNLNELIRLVNAPARRSKLANLLLFPYFASVLMLALLRDADHPLLYFSATVSFYFCLFLYFIIRYPSSKLQISYVIFTFLSLDSIIQTLGCIFLDLITEHFNRDIVLKTASLLFNVLVLLSIKYLLKPNRNQVRDSIRLLPQKVYALILASLVLIGNLCGNLAVPNDDLLFSHDINHFFIALTVLIFIAVIVLFIFNSISKRYYESISKLMEEQVEAQIRYYKKIDQLNENLREFRHDYRNHMISLQSLLECHAYEEAMEYVREITKQDIIENRKFFSGNQIADAIMNDKSEYARKNGSTIYFDGFISDEIPSSDLCIILSNALDNAVEACSHIVSNTPKEIKVKCAVRQNVQVICISNPNERDSTETRKTDKENHGFGLYNIRRTVEKLNGQMQIPSMVPFFVLELEFCIKKSDSRD